MDKNLVEVIRIASRELRKCYTEEGIIAGLHHFTDYWARDGFFASLGSLSVGDYKVVKKMVNLFYKHQRGDGLIPYRILRGPITLGKYLGHPKFFTGPRPTYKLRGIGNEVLDGTSLTLLITSKLGLENKLNFKKYSLRIKVGLKYLIYRERQGLLYDGLMAEWNDTALKWGNLLYSNIIYWYMYDQLSTWTNKIDRVWHKQLVKKKNLIGLALKERLWNGKYFSDWFDYKRQDYLYPFGNCLAVAWGLTNKKESESIINECEKLRIAFTLETNFPKYPFWRIDPLQRLIGTANYQNQSTLWWQPVISYLAALKKVGKKSEVQLIENEIITKIFKDKKIYECYERSGKPYNRLYFTSEQPFAWASGMLLWALSLK